MPATTALSVIVPCRDAARHLPTTFASIDANTTDDTEWLFVDDGSDDGTARLLADFRPRAGRSRVLTQPTPLGVSAARNRGVAEATGRHLAFLDADDWFAPGHLQRMTAAISELDVDFVRTDHVQATGTVRAVHRVPEGRRWRALPAHDGIDLRPGTLSAVDAPNLWAGIYHRRLAEAGLLTVDPAIRTAEDRLIVWRLHLFAERFAVVGLLGYCYRREVRGSLTAIGDERQLDFFAAYDAAGADLDRDAAVQRFRPKLVRAYVAVIAHHEANRGRLTAAVHRTFRRRARATLRGLPQPLVDAAVSTMDPRRARMIERLR